MIVTQTQFARGLFDPAIPAPDGLSNPDGSQASKRFDVYRNNVAVSLSDALETAFPVVRKLVGEEFFRAMAGVYLRTHKPSSPLMMFYGDKMPQFLKRFGPAKPLKYLPDVARVEIGLRKAYHASDVDPIDSQKLAALAPDDLMGVRMSFAPAVQVIKSDHPIHGIYTANTQADAPKPTLRPETVLITRPGFDPQLHLIDTATTTCILALMEGQPLGVAMTQAGDNLDLGAALGLLLGQGALTDLN